MAARARLNAVLIIAVCHLCSLTKDTLAQIRQLFIGQVMGTAVGTEVFIQHGWRAAAAVSMAWFGLQLVVLFVRGPHVKRYTWFGYEGGLEARKSVVTAKEKEKERANEKAAEVADPDQKQKDGPDAGRPKSTHMSQETTIEGHEHRGDEKDPSQFV